MFNLDLSWNYKTTLRKITKN